MVRGAGGVELNGLWQMCGEFLLKCFVLFTYFYHVHMLHLVCDLHASKRNVVVLATAYDRKGPLKPPVANDNIYRYIIPQLENCSYGYNNTVI